MFTQKKIALAVNQRNFVLVFSLQLTAKMQRIKSGLGEEQYHTIGIYYLTIPSQETLTLKAYPA